MRQKSRGLVAFAVVALLALLFLVYDWLDVYFHRGPELHAHNEGGVELPVYELSDEQAEALFSTPTIAMSMDDLDYFTLSGQSIIDYAMVSTADFRNAEAEPAQDVVYDESGEASLVKMGYLQGPPLNMEHLADTVDYYRDRQETVALVIYYDMDPFGGEAYQKKFQDYASSFERANVLEYWGEQTQQTVQNPYLVDVLNALPVGDYDHLMIVMSKYHPDLAASDWPTELQPRDDIHEVTIYTYMAASLRGNQGIPDVLAAKYSVVPILRPLMSWEDQPLPAQQ